MNSSVNENKPNKALNGKNFLYNIGESSFLNFDNLIQFASLSSATENNDSEIFLRVNKPKEACFVCYKLILSDETLIAFNKHFCSDFCFESFNKASLVIFN